jgi:hypothetical protein
VGDQLRLHVACHLSPAQDLARFQAPYGACCVDWRGAYQIRIDLVPVEWRQGCTKVRVFILCK